MDAYFGKNKPPAPNEQWAARRRLAKVMRQMNELTVTTSADVELLDAVTAELERQVAQLTQGVQAAGKLAYMDADKDHMEQRAIVGHETGPFIGLCNPLSPPVDIWLEGDEVKGRVTMGWQYEGPPECVHGGYVAALFDDFLGMGQKLTKRAGFTGTLKVRYIKPTPLNQELTLIGRVDSIEGRKNKLSGEIYAGDLLTASCEGLFVHMPPDYLENLKKSLKT